jgi:hypothetical protein
LSIGVPFEIELASARIGKVENKKAPAGFSAGASVKARFENCR